MKNLLKKSIKQHQKAQDLIYGAQKLSNEIRSKSKKITALMRRNNIAEAKKLIKEVENLFRSINQVTKQNKELLNQSFYKEATEEYIEAVVLYSFLEKVRIKIPKFIKIGAEEIISGICDFTGELLRRAVTTADKKELKQLITFQDAMEDVAQEMTKIGFRGKLRQKYDEVERNLKKIENILYDIRLKE